MALILNFNAAHRAKQLKQPIHAIEKLQNTPQGHKQAEALNQQIRQQWRDRGSASLKQQQGLMDQTRRVIKDSLGADHWSLDYIKFTTAEYTELNNLKQHRVAQRNEATQQLDNPSAIVAKAARLLDFMLKSVKLFCY
ncbi:MULTISPECIES: hypothetical protein [Leptolyngbya]|jgi:hypothetical protein|uniref:hypothetical protein n=1 Tax=Leptolyngbya TaxID=47251 RepID=UPI00036EF4E5|nr:MULTISPECIES: hypothetical protein [Leptolyngbya]MBD2371122.1 hypothetical protein [Leptolyngbya sp. FACHB-161]MBD2377590.1 hypothetical protein [Leptolyngbya sp. FACHB-238]MBD2402043.1 hypothetical protein [Leptolyngbya sp. FACHB-239]MBD2408562.1 hypothetical protein [Leptolyngbya sp. FACHB-402]BAS60466.1 hypothetical protein LBWT_Y0540 [Leptolyngbya boryana IAM M-101]